MPGGGGQLREFDPTGQLAARDTKAWGAAVAGEAIRNHPVHRDETEAFLSQPFTPTERGARGYDLTSLDRLVGLSDPPWHPKTFGEALIARRVSDMMSRGGPPIGKLGQIKSPTQATLWADYRNRESIQDATANPATHRPPESVPELLANMRKNGMEDYIPHPIDELVSAAQEHWAGSSTNDSASLALMSTVANHQLGMKTYTPFDASGTATFENKHDAHEEWNQRTGVYQALAYGIHEASVQHFESIGLHPTDKIRLYRGMFLNPDHPAASVIAQHAPQEIPKWYKGPIPSQQAHIVETTMNPISSWSTNLRTAREQFGDHVFRAEIAVKDIFATSATGFGSQAEYEVVPYGGTTQSYWAAKSIGSSEGTDVRGFYPPIMISPAGRAEEPFSVERVLEFVNHNHTPGRGHPNAGGSALKTIDVQRGAGVALQYHRETEFNADEIKSMGAAAAGEAIRNSPKHNAAVQAFLNQHPDQGIPVALTGNLMGGMKYGLGAGSLKADTIGETLILRRFDGMVSHGQASVRPLDTGRFNASDEAAAHFRDPPKGPVGETVSGNFIHFNMNYPKEATTVKEAIANLERNGLHAYIPKAEDELVAHVQNAWADSATTNITSVTLMYAAAKQKGIPATVARVAHPTDEVSHSIDLTRNLADREYANNAGLYDALAYGVHKVSVDHLARNGITPTDHVQLYRGMDLKGAEVSIVRGEVDTRTLRTGNLGAHRAEAASNVTATMNPLSSWTTDRATTTIFGSTTFRYDVVARDIFATSATGFGAANEFEVVTYGSRPRQMRVVFHNYGEFPENFAVERPLEFVNHNHTPGRGHPNAAGVAASVTKVLDDSLRQAKYKGCDPLTGHCYVASEAAYHMLGGKEAGYKPMFVKHEGEPHWFLEGPNGTRLDITAGQFKTPVPYEKAVGKGFLTAKPSARAQTVINRVNLADRPVKQRGTVTITNGHTVTSEYMTARKVKDLNAELDRQGVDKLAPIRGVVDHPSYMMAISRKDGKINGALAYTHGTRVSQYDNQTALEDMRTSPERGGAGTALLAHVAKESLGVHNSEMAGYSMIQSAHPFYEKLGAVLHRTGTLEGGTRSTGTGRWDTEALTKLADKASPLTASAEEFINRNHTPTSAHPNYGTFLAGQREEANSPKILKGASDSLNESSDEFKVGLRARRDEFIGDDPVRLQVVDFISRWTGIGNAITQIRNEPKGWAAPLAWMKEHAVPNDVPLYRSVQLGRFNSAAIQDGEKIPNRMAASFTESKEYMEGYRDTRIIIEPGQVRGIPIAWLSNTPHEKEWLVLSDLEVVSKGMPIHGRLSGWQTPVTVRGVDE